MEVLSTKAFERFLPHRRVYYFESIVKIRTSPSVCADRVKKRCRSDEELRSVDEDHLASAHSFHEKWMQDESNPVLILDFDEDFTDYMESLITSKVN